MKGKTGALRKCGTHRLEMNCSGSYSTKLSENCLVTRSPAPRSAPGNRCCSPTSRSGSTTSKSRPPEFRDGIYYFKASLGECWRRIAIPAKSDLDELADSIIDAFDFDGDHLYAFYLVARDGRQFSVEHPYVDDADTHTDELTIGELPLTERESMLFQYDFGADWQFDVQLEKVEPEAAKIAEATLVESRGKSAAGIRI